MRHPLKIKLFFSLCFLLVYSCKQEQATVNNSSTTATSLTNLNPDPQMWVALTYDDGPHVTAPDEDSINRTKKVRTVLSEKRVIATFFVEHSRITSKDGQRQLRESLDNGHEIAIHGIDPNEHHRSWDITLNFETKLSNMITIMKILPKIGGTEEDPLGQVPKFGRPPGGEVTLRQKVKEHQEKEDPDNSYNNLEELDAFLGNAEINTFENDASIVKLAASTKNSFVDGKIEDSTMDNIVSIVAGLMDKAI